MWCYRDSYSLSSQLSPTITYLDNATYLPFTFLFPCPLNFYGQDLRDRSFSLKGGGVMVFYSVEKTFFGQRKSQNIFFLLRKAQFFFPEINIRLYDKNSESDYFFLPPPKSEYFFQQHWESEYFFQKKTHKTPTPSPSSS